MPEDNTNPIKQFLLSLGVTMPFEQIISALVDANGVYRETMHPKFRYIIDAVFTQMFLDGFLSIRDLAQGAGVAKPLPGGTEVWVKNLLEEATKLDGTPGN